jgi:hypothetical protein
MKAEIKNTRHGEPYGRLVYASKENVEEIMLIDTGVMDVKGILKLIAYLVEYLKGIL